MTEKRKNDESRTKNLKFILLWIVLVTAMAQLSGILFRWVYPWMMEQVNPDKFSWVIVLLYTLTVPFTAPVEKALLRLRFGQWVRGWISASFLSEILSYSIMPLLWANNINLPLWQSSLLGALFTLPQVWILRRYVKHAWLYPLASAISSFIATNIAMNFVDNTLGASIAYGTGMAIMALTMLFLFTHPKNGEKAKRAEAETYSRLADGAADIEAEMEKEFEQEKSTKRRSISDFVLSQLQRWIFWRSWQKA